MNRLRTLRLAWIAIAFSLVAGSVYAAGPFSAVFVFGDSLSDNGNLGSVQGDFPPPFFGNRVSNGPVAVEELAIRLGLPLDPSLFLLGLDAGSNYAVIGARAAGTGPLDLPAQVGAFLFAHAGAAPADALYVVFIGGNDVRDARDTPRRRNAREIVARAAEAIGDQLRVLIQAGARSVLVVNSPDIGAIPETSILAAERHDRRLVRKATRLSRRFNARLAHEVREVEEDLRVPLVELDLFGFLRTVLEEASGLGYTNTAEACFSTVTFSFNPACELGARFDQFVFFDEIHPSGATHARAGRVFFALVPAAPVAH